MTIGLGAKARSLLLGLLERLTKRERPWMPRWTPRLFRTEPRSAFSHHRAPGLSSNHQKPFRESTGGRGEHASGYFRRSGISALALESGGACTFRLGRSTAIYQVTNAPLLREDVLAPSTDTNRELFGEFMGSLTSDHPDRPAKRAAVERSLGSIRFVDQLERPARKHAADFLERAAGRELPLDEFALLLVAHVDSLVPGVLDLAERPLTWYLAESQYARVVRDFFEIASDVISNVNRDAMKEIDLIVPFVRDLLESNIDCIREAPESNLIKRYFAIWNKPLTRAAIDQLSAAQLKELGTIIVATFDTTALSLLWAFAYLETSPAHRARVVEHAGDGSRTSRISVTDLAVLEAVRLGGSNPTALWRRTIAPCVVTYQGRSASVPAGTMMWLDRRRANQDPAVFPNPRHFDLDNISAIVRSERETVSSLLSRNRYEINSFSMINSETNSRKCPGRLFSVRLQSILLSKVYGEYNVTSHGIDVNLKPHSSMPRPAQPGVVKITPISVNSAGGRS